jgi:hypothetical protein
MRIKVNIRIKFQGIKLKNKYSKQNIHSNQKFEDQIWYNQQIIWYFKNFHNFHKSIFCLK